MSIESVILESLEYYFLLSSGAVSLYKRNHVEEMLGTVDDRALVFDVTEYLRKIVYYKRARKLFKNHPAGLGFNDALPTRLRPVLVGNPQRHAFVGNYYIYLEVNFDDENHQAFQNFHHVGSQFVWHAAVESNNPSCKRQPAGLMNDPDRSGGYLADISCLQTNY